MSAQIINYLAIEILEQVGQFAPSEAEINTIEQAIECCLQSVCTKIYFKKI